MSYRVSLGLAGSPLLFAQLQEVLVEAAPAHLTPEQLESGMPHIQASPQDGGKLTQIYLRPDTDQRQLVAEADLSPEGGIAGDRWVRDHWQRLPNGDSDPETQVSLMNTRILELISSNDETAMGLAGDNLIVDLDLSEENLPAGSQIRIGDEVVVQISEEPHTGCKKFAARYGVEAMKFINGPTGEDHHLRGRLGRIVTGGKVFVGDEVSKIK